MLPAHAVEVGTGPLVRPARNSVGGRPFLDQAQDWPVVLLRCLSAREFAVGSVSAGSSTVLA